MAQPGATKDKILAIIEADGPISAGQIFMKLGWRKWFVSIYPVLFELERTGQVTTEWANEPYPRRRLYRINKP